MLKRVLGVCASSSRGSVGTSGTSGKNWRDLSPGAPRARGVAEVGRSFHAPPVRYQHAEASATASTSATAGAALTGGSSCAQQRVRPTSAPTPTQLRTLFVHSAVPFVAFGFVDNTVLIHMGDAIDTTFGVYFGLPTLAAAAIGQVFSDTTGVVFGSSIEALATRLGLPVPNLSVAQRTLRITKFVSTAGAAVGVITGCCLGMINLLFIDLGASERQRQAAELKTIFSSIMEQGHQVAECERASLFIVDMEKRDLWSVNDVGVRIPLGAGFAGAAATTGQTIHAEAAHEDARFYPEVDARTGVVTRNILTMPVKNNKGVVVAVVEFRNKSLGRAFTSTDEKLLLMLCQNVAVFLERSIKQSAPMNKSRLGSNKF